MKHLTVILILISATALLGCGASSHTVGITDPDGLSRSRTPQVPGSPEECTLQGNQVTCEEFFEFGRTFYSNNCAECHDPIEMSDVGGKTLVQFNTAIFSRPKMKKFAILTEDERRAIIAALQ